MTHELANPLFEEIRVSMVADGTTVKEAAIKLWGEKFSAKTIMGVLAIDEPTLETIIPKSLWFYDHWAVCHQCKGRGGHSFTDQKETP